MFEVILLMINFKNIKNYNSKIMKILFLSIITVLFMVPIQAQNTGISSGQRRINVDFVSVRPIEKAEGSPFISENFLPAKINNSKESYAVRYNAAQDEMQIKGENSETLLLDKNKEYIVKLSDGSNKLYQTVSYADGTRGYAISIWTDANKNGLFIKEKIKFSPEKAPKSSYDQGSPAKYSRVKDAFYMRNGENSALSQLSSNKKKFYAAFKGKEKEVQGFVKKEKLKINKKEDLMKIMLFYFSS